MNDNYFGLCPHCHKTDGWLNIGKEHWLYCVAHRVKWTPGTNLFSSWRNETEDQQRARYEALDFGNYQEVKPYFGRGAEYCRAFEEDSTRYSLGSDDPGAEYDPAAPEAPF